MGPGRRTHRPGALLPLLLLVLAAPAAGQACLGHGIGGLAPHAVLAHAGFASYEMDGGVDGTDLGVAYAGNPGGPLAYSARLTRRLMGEGSGDLNVGEAQLAGEVPPVLGLPPGAGACLTVGAAAAWLPNGAQGTDYTAYSFPIGAAIGFTLPAGPISRLYPYVHPRLILTRTAGEVLGFDVRERYSSLGVEAGVGFARGTLLGRLRAAAAARPEGSGIAPYPDLSVGVEAGIRF